MPILFRTHDSSFREMMIDRYCGFIGFRSRPTLEFEVELVTPSGEMESEEDAQVEMRDGLWHFRRGTSGRGGIPGQVADTYGSRRILILSTRSCASCTA